MLLPTEKLEMASAHVARATVRRLLAEPLPARPARKKRPGSRIQSLVISKEHFTRSAAKAWAKAHGFKHADVDEMPNTWRLRQIDPDQVRKTTFGTITLRPGVQAVVAVPRR